MAFFRCPYLHSNVELTEGREKHIAQHHPDLLPTHQSAIATTLENPDQVRRSERSSNAHLFTLWFDEIRGGKYVVVVVVSDSEPVERNWIVTAYIARRLAAGRTIEWQRD